ncbi:NUDIX domain-containing protein [uncultured Roseibium sp.]|uniref:NUDIX hydrolase n=1 Tax=uncultured Roseibium sp. TaxID=1936171 RepID=UPI002605D73A|nr:NUDIX domain-containing protein [uncultured Roseibium sp.]
MKSPAAMPGFLYCADSSRLHPLGFLPHLAISILTLRPATDRSFGGRCLLTYYQLSYIYFDNKEFDMDYPKPAVAVDLALITVLDEKLCCLLMRRHDAEIVGGDWAIPGGYVHIEEAIEATAERVLRDKVGLSDVYLEQLYTYGAPARDPRERVISVTHFALVDADRLGQAIADNANLLLAEICADWNEETGGIASAHRIDGETLTLAFDHAFILGDVVKRLRGKLDYTSIALELLPPLFTLRQAQEVYEAILGKQLTKPAFRRKLLDRNIIKPTGKRETGSAFRPAELYARI